ncbi:MAG: aldo/keto reductase [Myxococcota bacterium]
MANSLVRSTPRKLGPFEVGPLAYGLWRFTDPSVESGQQRIEAALQQGFNLIDVADVYGLDWNGTGFGSVEAQLGRVLAAAPDLRSKIVLATKGGIRPPIPYDSSAHYLTEAVEASLKRLNTDVIDVYQIHRPDMFTHPAELAQTLAALRSAGKIREVGVSNYTPAQVSALAAHLPFSLVSQQPEFSAAQLAPLRDGTLDQCMQLSIVPLAWSPLAGGRIPRAEGIAGPLVSALDAIAQREDVERSTVALAFVLAHPSAPVAILGTQDLGRIRDARRALDVHLDRNDVYNLIEASEGAPLP